MSENGSSDSECDVSSVELVFVNVTDDGVDVGVGACDDEDKRRLAALAPANNPAATSASSRASSTRSSQSRSRSRKKRTAASGGKPRRKDSGNNSLSSAEASSPGSSEPKSDLDENQNEICDVVKKSDVVDVVGDDPVGRDGSGRGLT